MQNVDLGHGGSRKRRQRRPHLDQHFLIFIQFSGKSGQIVGWRPSGKSWICHCRGSQVVLITKQESSPAWTQEAHCPPGSKCSLCWSVFWWVEGGGYPSSLGRGVRHPILEGVPHPVLDRGNPHQVLTRRVPLIHQQDGYPLIWTRDGVPPPPIQTRDRVAPPRQVWTDWKNYLASSFGCGR